MLVFVYTVDTCLHFLTLVYTVDTTKATTLIKIVSIPADSISIVSCCITLNVKKTKKQQKTKKTTKNKNS